MFEWASNSQGGDSKNYTVGGIDGNGRLGGAYVRLLTVDTWTRGLAR